MRPHQDILDADTNDVCEIDTCEHVENELSCECPKETVFRVMGSQNCSELLRAAPRPRRGPGSRALEETNFGPWWLAQNIPCSPVMLNLTSRNSIRAQHEAHATSEFQASGHEIIDIQ